MLCVADSPSPMTGKRSPAGFTGHSFFEAESARCVAWSLRHRSANGRSTLLFTSGAKERDGDSKKITGARWHVIRGSGRVWVLVDLARHDSLPTPLGARGDDAQQREERETKNEQQMQTTECDKEESSLARGVALEDRAKEQHWREQPRVVDPGKEPRGGRNLNWRQLNREISEKQGRRDNQDKPEHDAMAGQWEPPVFCAPAAV